MRKRHVKIKNKEYTWHVEPCRVDDKTIGNLLVVDREGTSQKIFVKENKITPKLAMSNIKKYVIGDMYEGRYSRVHRQTRTSQNR